MGVVRLTKDEAERLLKEIAACFPGNEDRALALLESHYIPVTKRIGLNEEKSKSLIDFHTEHREAFEKRKKFDTPHALKILEGSLQTSPDRPEGRQVSEKPNLDRYDRSGSFTKRFK